MCIEYFKIFVKLIIFTWNYYIKIILYWEYNFIFAIIFLNLLQEYNLNINLKSNLRCN